MSNFKKNSVVIIIVSLAFLLFESKKSIELNLGNQEYDCIGMEKQLYDNVSSKSGIDALLEADILNFTASGGIVDWDCLINSFDEMGPNYSVKLLPNGGFDGADVVRFSVENRSLLTDFTSAPGASNGIFTSIINRTDDGRVAIVERGGELRWLKLE